MLTNIFSVNTLRSCACHLSSKLEKCASVALLTPSCKWHLVTSQPLSNRTMAAITSEKNTPAFFRAGKLFPANVLRISSDTACLLLSRYQKVLPHTLCLCVCVNSRYRSIMCCVSNNGFRFRCELLKLRVMFHRKMRV